MYGLTDVGKQQAQNLARHVTANREQLRITKIFTSDLPRAVETAAPIAAVLGLEPILLPEFRETNNGVFAGMPHEVADALYPGLFWRTLDWDEPYPDGESPRAFYERVCDAWAQFSQAVAANGENVLLVSHGGVMNIIYSIVEGRKFSNKDPHERIPNATLSALQYENGCWVRMETERES